MNPINRRTALQCGVLGAILPRRRECRDDSPDATVPLASPPKPTVHEEYFVVGPFSLGELFERMPEDEDERDTLPRGGGPTRSDIVTALSECKVTILDRRRRVGNEWDFEEWNAQRHENHPKVLLEGRLAHILKNAAGADFNIRVAEIRFLDSYTRPLSVSKGLAAYRNVRFLVKLDTDEVRISEIISGRNLTFSTNMLRYEAAGTWAWE